MKEELRNESLDIGMFLERAKDRVLDQKVEEMIRAIYSMGEYRLSDDYQHLAVTSMQQCEMSAIQRKDLTKKVFQAELVLREKVNCHLSVQYNAIKEIVKVPFYILKQVWSITEFVLENYEIQRLIYGKFCVPDIDIAFSHFSKDRNLRCPCQQYDKTNGLCTHVVAVAEKEGVLKTFISSYIETDGNINKVFNNTPENAGSKPKQKKKQKTKKQDLAETTSARVPLPLYNVSPNQQLLIPKLTFKDKTVYRTLS